MQLETFDPVTRQSENRTAPVPAASRGNIADGNPAHRTVLRDCGSVSMRPVALAQTNEDRHLSPLNFNVADVDILANAAIHTTHCDTGDSFFTPKYLLLAGRRFNSTIGDGDTLEATGRLGAGLDGITVTTDHAVGDRNILTSSRASALQTNTIVIAIQGTVAEHKTAATVNVDAVVVAIRMIVDINTVNNHIFTV